MEELGIRTDFWRKKLPVVIGLGMEHDHEVMRQSTNECSSV